MKLTLNQLETHLAKSLATIYIVSGEDIFLKNDAIQLIRKAAKKSGFTERARFTVESGFDWDDLYAHLYSTSMLAEKSFIELDCRQTTPVKTGAQLLKEYGEKPSNNTILLLDTNKIDDKIAKSAWYKSLEKAGVVIAIWPIPREQLPQWIMQRVKKYKLSIALDAAQLLADYVEGNLTAAAQAIEKLYLLQPQASIDVDLVKQVLTDESQFNVFDFIDALIAGDTARTLHILRHLEQDGTEPVLLLWGITRELRSLADMAQKAQQGESSDAVMQKHRVFARRQPLIRRFLSRTTAADCWRYLTHAADIDAIIKGAKAGNSWKCLELFCLRFAKN